MTSDMISPVGQSPDLVLQHLLVDSKMSVGVKVVVFAEMKDKLDDSSLFLHHTSSSRHWRGSWPSPCRGARRRPPWLTRERWTSLFELIGIGRFRNTKALLLLLLQNRTSHIDLTRTHGIGSCSALKNRLFQKDRNYAVLWCCCLLGEDKINFPLLCWLRTKQLLPPRGVVQTNLGARIENWAKTT